MSKEIQKTVLEQNFNYALNQASPVQKDYNRVVNYDEDGNEYVTYEEVDYPKFQASLGSWKDWSLTALLKAGIDPAFPIHTGMTTRLEGVGIIEGIAADVDAFVEANSEIPQENVD